MAGGWWLEADEGEAGSGVGLLLQVLGALRKDDFAGGADDGLLEMSAVGGAVAAADDDVGVDLGLSVVEGDVSEEGEQLDLLVEVHGGLVLLRFPVEPGEADGREGSDGVEAAAGEAMGLGKLLQLRGELLAGVEDESESAGLAAEDFVAHEG